MRLSIISFLSLVVASAALEEVTLDLSASPVKTMTVESDQDPSASEQQQQQQHSFLSHYGPPPNGCEKDEKAFQIQGIPGGICAAKCTDFLPCPKDLPDGVTAAPQCALQDQSGLHYCVLVCQSGGGTTSNGDANLRGGLKDEQCGEATCQPVPGQDGLGICTFT